MSATAAIRAATKANVCWIQIKRQKQIFENQTPQEKE
jgi:hypothetical protein